MDTELKRFYENMLEMYKEISIHDAMLCKYNTEIFNKYYEAVSQDMMNYWKEYNKSLDKKFAEKDGVPCINNQASKNIIPASKHDIYNYSTRQSMLNPQFHAIMKLDGRLDFYRLKRAVRLSFDAEPVLGSRFVEGVRPYWKRLENLDKISFCSLEVTNNSDSAIFNFLQSHLDMSNDPMIKVKIIRAEKYDILAVKISNTCYDGVGTKEYIQLLSYIYSCLEQGITFEPEPRKHESNDQYWLTNELDVISNSLIVNSLQDKSNTMWAFPWKQREGGASSSVCFEFCSFSQPTLELIYQYGKSKGATVNDLILTAYYRALFKISKPPYGASMDISSAVNLRRYLPNYKTQAIRNLSGGSVSTIARTKNESFEGTLTRVMSTTKKFKNRNAEFNNAISNENGENIYFTHFHDYFEHMPQNSNFSVKSSTRIDNVCFPGLSNLGYISPSLINFGKLIVTDANLLPPVVRSPGLLLFASSYNGTLTMSIGYCIDSMRQRDMKSFLNIIKNELMRGCECKK